MRAIKASTVVIHQKVNAPPRMAACSFRRKATLRDDALSTDNNKCNQYPIINLTFIADAFTIIAGAIAILRSHKIRNSPRIAIKKILFRELSENELKNVTSTDRGAHLCYLNGSKIAGRKMAYNTIGRKYTSRIFIRKLFYGCDEKEI
jgi:hypothetical protein